MRRVISDGHDMLPFSRFTHATQRHKALADASGKVIFRLPILMLVLQLFTRSSLMLAFMRFQILNTGVVETGEMRRVKYIVFFSALYNSKHVFSKLNFVVHFIQV